MSKKHHILILGGSTFMGKSLLTKLSQHPSLDVHFVNRGRKYWNNEVKKISNANFSYGNRDEKKDFTKVLAYLSKKLGISGGDGSKWDAVIDFSAFNYKHVRSVYNALRGKTKLYIFISTDSVYDLCDQSIRKEDLIIEEYDIRPTDETEKRRLIKNDNYGHDKLKCEEYLHFLRYEMQQEKKDFDFPFLIFRLPDVIGPYDDTNRYWCYLKLIKEYEKMEFQISKDLEKKTLSFVFSEDVSNLIEKIVTSIMETGVANQDFIYQSFNLAFEEPIKLSDFISKICEEMKIPMKRIAIKEDPLIFYPSVDCGSLNINKAKKKLDWTPTPLSDAVAKTNQFFMNAKGKYQDEEKKVEEKLAKKLKTH